MSSTQLTRVLGGWEGYAIGTVQRFEAGAKGVAAQVWIELRPRADRVKVCGGCGRAVAAVHDVSERWVRDLPILDAQTHLLVHRCRLACPRCGPKLERLAWLDRHARVTTRLAESVARLCAVLPIKHVAQQYGLGWDRVKTIDKAYLDKTLGPVDLDDLEVIAMDEFALHKGHRYATVIIEPRIKRVLWVGRGRSCEDVRPFFELLGPERCAKLRAAAMSQTHRGERAFDRVGRPQVRPVLGGEVVERQQHVAVFGPAFHRFGVLRLPPAPRRRPARLRPTACGVGKAGPG